MTTGGTRTAYRTCPLCEAGCGLEITLAPDADGREQVTRIRGDRDDVFSHGFICPKGSTLKQLHEDPDRLVRPLVKRGGEFVEVSWPEAWQAVHDGLTAIIDTNGRDAVGVYLGNPGAHNLGSMIYGRTMLKALGTKSVFSASTVDQRPKEISAGLMFGGFTVPVPDVDRTDFLLLLGANPWASNGSLATAPDWPGRIERMLERGGELVVVDPRRSRTAEAATEWIAIRPGTDAHLLAAVANVLFTDGLVDLGSVADHVAGLADVEQAMAPFTPEAVEAVTGVAAATIRDLARRLAAAPTAAVYGRIGTCTQAFGTAASWLVDVVNICTGNLDRPGGAMFSKAAAGSANTRGTPGTGRGMVIGRRHSRVRGLPESLGELPVAALAEEIETEGDGQIRAMVTVAGNPILSTPNSGRLEAAFAGLDFMVSVDIYVNETTRHADVILPAPSALQKSHYDLALLQVALRNVANWSEPVLPLEDGQPDEWEVLAKLALIAQGVGPDADTAIADDLTIGALVQSSIGDASSPVHGRDPEELLAELAPRTGPARIMDFFLRTGPYGDGFGVNPGGLTLDVLLSQPHGVDFGALEPRIPEVLRTPTGCIELAPPALLDDVVRLEKSLTDGSLLGTDERPFLLIGRRHLRSNNSWMHNINVLVKGKPRCTLHLHPDDATALGLADGDPAVVGSRTGTVTIPVEVTDAIRPGVVSIPHGWGHDAPESRMRVASEHAGVNSNILADEELLDPISGNAVFNGIPVSVAAAG